MRLIHYSSIKCYKHNPNVHFSQIIVYLKECVHKKIIFMNTKQGSEIATEM